MRFVNGEYDKAVFQIDSQEVGGQSYSCDKQSVNHHVESQTVGKNAFVLFAGLTFHYVGFRLFRSESDGGQCVRYKVYPQQVRRFKQGEAQKRSNEYCHNFRKVGREQN